MHCAPTRTISIFMSTDSTATSATDGNNNSFSLSTNSSTAGTFDPLAPTTAHFRATSGPLGHTTFTHSVCSTEVVPEPENGQHPASLHRNGVTSGQSSTPRGLCLYSHRSEPGPSDQTTERSSE